MIFEICCINVILLFFTLNTDYQKNKRWEIGLAEAISVFFGLFLVVSSILWSIDTYSIEKSMIIVTLVNIALLLLSYILCKKRNINIFEISGMSVSSKWLVSRATIILLCFVSLGTYSVFGIGRNDGNAIVQAYSLSNNQNKLNYDIEEFDDILPHSKYAEYFFNTISEIDQTNFTGEYSLINDVMDKDTSVTKMQGKYGNNPVYASFLEIGVKIFGFLKTSYINVFLLYCILIFVDSILVNVGCKWSLRTTLVALCGISPLIVYSNHTAIVETVMMFCMVAFFYFFICKKEYFKIIAALFSVAMSVVSVSAYTIIPIVLIICWINYFVNREKSSLIVSLITSLGYGFSYLLLMITAYTNTIIVYKQGLFFVSDKLITPFVIIGIVLSLVIPVLLLVMYKAGNSVRFKEFLKIKGRTIFKLIIFGMTIGAIIYSVITGILKYDSFSQATKMSIVVITAVTGFVSIPIILFFVVRMNYKLTVEVFSLVSFFTYGVFLYAGILRPRVSDYYFEARFLLPFIPFVFITAGIMMKDTKKDSWVIPLIALAASFIPYTMVLMKPDVDERIGCENVDNVIEVVKNHSDEDTLILVEKSLLKDFYHALDSIEGLKVYPYEKSIKSDFAKSINTIGKRVIYITTDEKNNYAKKFTCLYSNDNNISKVAKKDYSPIFRLPLRYTESVDETLQVIEISDFSKTLNITDFKDGIFTFDDIKLELQDIETYDNVATIRLFVTEEKEVLYNNSKELRLSYHLNFNDKSKNVYENPRFEICNGKYVNGFSQEVDILLSDIVEEEFTMTIDVVEEMIEWYSTNHSGCPVISFKRGKTGWSYEIIQ